MTCMDDKSYKKIIQDLKNEIKIKNMIIGDKDDKINELRLELKDLKQERVIYNG